MFESSVYVSDREGIGLDEDVEEILNDIVLATEVMVLGIMKETKQDSLETVTQALSCFK